MSSPDKDQKTEDPSAKRLGDARKKGNIPRSMDVNASVTIMVAAILLYWQWRNIVDLTRNRMVENLSAFPHGDLTIPALREMALVLTRETLLAIAPFLFGILLVGLLSSYAQVGMLYTLEPLKPSLNKLNPIQGFKRILSLRGVVETLKGLLKIAVVGSLSYAVISDRYEAIVTAVQAGRAQLGALLADTAWTIAWRSALALFVLGLLDYSYQRWEWWRNLKMTKQEVKDEAKQQEGSPEVKGEIRKRQRQAARRRMMQEVPTATVVITNPTHFAVALKYEREEMEVPVVVAKGTDLVAKRIRDLAREANVPLVENKPVAQALYRQVEVGDEIPPDMYAVVAEILVAVTRADAKARV
ncbi:flagellar biosynthesis protein FlhB [bacterium]|nr:flagellar biosynthesis protein FlhB [bacterium]